MCANGQIIPPAPIKNEQSVFTVYDIMTAWLHLLRIIAITSNSKSISLISKT